MNTIKNAAIDTVRKAHEAPRILKQTRLISIYIIKNILSSNVERLSPSLRSPNDVSMHLLPNLQLCHTILLRITSINAQL